MERRKLLPFTLTFLILFFDQLSKFLIVQSVPLKTIGFTAFGDFFRIIHARNPGIAFSLGRSFPDELRSVLFILLPIAVLAVLVVYYFRSEEFTAFQRWAIAGIVGGGAGNLIDRILRPDGVVDFIDVKFFGLFGLDRWPTFNIADSSVVVCGFLLAASLLLAGKVKENR
jgi:signal peptidase II